ncbi:S8 family serine peptidase [Actinosynnema sp. NPDC020468]|uniref:S8 family serine peptidase n=1 Tax=Actinosynnema sp. NPDC020468 TaxID=3154488 RepID=UPI0033F5AB4B
MKRRLAVACAAFTVLANAGEATAQDTDLPRIPQVLRAGTPCTAPSGKKVTEVPWSLRHLGADRLWPLTTGSGVTVAVLDTGVDGAAVPSDVLGDGGADCVGHGTVVASLIAGPVREGGVAGLAPGARVQAVRATDRLGAATPETIASAIDQAVRAGTRILCVGAVTTDGAPVLKAAVERATAAGALVVAAAGPDPADRPAEPARYYPASFPGVIPVASAGPDGKSDAGAGSLAAPGNLVVGTGPGGGHVVASGPAFAAAQVAATAALIRAYRPQATAAEITWRLWDTAYRQPGLILLDPLAAVTASGTTGGAPTGRPEPVVVATTPDLSATRASATAVVGGALVVTGLLAALAAVLPRGRRRGWRGGV